MRTAEREEWVDRVRGICMLAILLFHTENYYNGVEILPYALYVDNVLIAFFFVSGYLFHSGKRPFSFLAKIRSIFRSIILPYFIFTTLIAVPKTFAHSDTTMMQVIYGILTGHASWFVAALAVAEILFASMMVLCKQQLNRLAIVSSILFLLVAMAYHLIDNELLEQHNYWCHHNAMLMMPFLVMGYAYRHHTQWQLWFNRWRTIFFFVYFFAIIKGIVHAEHMTLTMQPIHVSSFFLLIADGLAGTVLLIAFCRWMRSSRLIQYVGRHSIIYYFICGGVPFVVTQALTRAGLPYNGKYPLIILASYLSCSSPQASPTSSSVFHKKCGKLVDNPVD